MADTVPKIVLTGGPCAGKSTVLNFLVQKLGEMGRLVFTVPEAATLVRGSGVRPANGGIDSREFQRAVLQTTFYLEGMVQEIAQITLQRGASPVIICDRGALDGLAYIDPDDFKELVEEFGHSIGGLLAERYNGVIHLRSAAVGVEEAYGFGNPERTESIVEAREKDSAVCKAWCGHTHLRVVPSEPDFSVKRQRVLVEVCAILGIPVPLEIERRYLVSLDHAVELPVPNQSSKIEQWYLKPRRDGAIERIRRRTQAGTHTYYRTSKMVVRHGVRSERESLLSEAEYLNALEDRDLIAEPIRKSRTCFVWEDQYFELDIFESNLTGLAILEIELTHEDQVVSLPPFLQVLREVTGDERFSNFCLAHHDMPRD